MRRVAIAAALAVLAGCGPDPSSVILYWDFQRNTLLPEGPVVYDVNVNVGGGDAACPQSGVETVTITDEAGRVVNPELPSVPCVFGGVQGVQIEDVARGRRVWTVTGYRGNVPVHVGTVELDVQEGLNEASVTLPGVPDDLDVNVAFFTANGVFLAGTCAGAGVGFLAYALYDGVGTLVATGDVPCPNPPGLTFRVSSGTGLDRDDYTARILGYRDAQSTDPLFDDQTKVLVPECQPSSFQHFGTDVGPYGWSVRMYDVSNPLQVRCP